MSKNGFLFVPDGEARWVNVEAGTNYPKEGELVKVKFRASANEILTTYAAWSNYVLSAEDMEHCSYEALLEAHAATIWETLHGHQLRAVTEWFYIP